MSSSAFRKSSLFRYITYTVLTAFVGLLPAQPAYAQVAIIMPPPGQMVHITGHFEPPQMVGLKINLKDPFSFGFIMDQGENPMSDSVKKEEFNKIIKYFLVSLAMPNKDMWVNLSPFESKRIIPEVFGQTEMGRDLLAQDYVLKQFTGSLMYPENGLGKIFWNKVYQEAQARFGTTDIDVNTFNKVWIVADHADVYQKGDTAFLVGSHLKVMLEQDFKAIESNKEQFGDVNAMNNDGSDAKTQMASQLVREIILPAIEKEVNDGQSFAAVRQIYNAEIMATWFKKTLRESLLGQVFVDKSKIAGQKVSDPQAREKIFQQYLMAYKKGVFDYIKRDTTPDGQIVTRRYLSGGMEQVGLAQVSGTNDQDIADLQEKERQLREELTDKLHQAAGTAAVEKVITDHFAATPNVSSSSPVDIFKGIIKAPMSPEIKVRLMTELVRNLMPQQNVTDDQREKLEAQLSDVLSKENVTTDDVLGVLAANEFSAPSLNSREPIAPALATAIATTPQLADKGNSQETAGLVTHLLNQRMEAVANEAKDFGAKEEQLPPKRLSIANVDFVEPKASPTPIDLVKTVAETTKVSPEARAETIVRMISHWTGAVAQERQQLVSQLSDALRDNAIEKVLTLVADHLAAYPKISSNMSIAPEMVMPVVNAIAKEPAESMPQGSAADVGKIMAQVVAKLTAVSADRQQQLAAQLSDALRDNETQKVQALVKNNFDTSSKISSSTPGEMAEIIANTQGVSAEARVSSIVNMVSQLTNATAEEQKQLADQLRQAQNTEEILNVVTKNIDAYGVNSTTPIVMERARPMLRSIAATPEASTQQTVSTEDMGEIMSRLVPQFSGQAIDPTFNTQFNSAQQDPNPTAALQALIVKYLPDQAMVAPQTQMPNVPGGINLSDEHLTMNIKVDGAGMPLPPRYQDKALMNLNGLVSIIRSITPLTQQNVPALYELAK